jgi:hypothetical protein
MKQRSLRSTDDIIVIVFVIFDAHAMIYCLFNDRFKI